MHIKLLWVLPFFFSSGLIAFGQHDLSGSRRHSVYTYVYRVTEKEALALFRSGMKDPGEKYLHTLVDSFATDSFAETRPFAEMGPFPEVGSLVEAGSFAKGFRFLPPGNYLWVSAAGSKLVTELHTNGDLRYDLINNNHDLSLSFRTREGNPVQDVKASIDHRSIPYDSATHTYRISRWKREGTVKVSYQGTCYFFSIKTNNPGYHFRRSFGYRLAHFGDQPSYERRFRSFMVFSKPKYKPRDTVQGKAFLMSRKGRPLSGPLWLRISDRGLDTDTLIDLIRPYRSGGYSFSFALTDSLHLPLDEEYQVTLEGSKGRPYKPKDNKREPDEDKHATKRKVKVRGHFKYEDYSLQSVRFTGRTDKRENSPGDPVSLYLRATDENELPLPDARVELQVLTSRQADRFRSPGVFIKDTLMAWSQSLDPVGETKITLPDSIFPAADFAYTIHCALLNSSNEYKTETFYQSYKDEAAKIFFFPRQDSLEIDWRIRNHSSPAPSLLYAFDGKDDTLESRVILLPGVIRINPYVSRYEVRPVADSVLGEFQVNSQKPPISCLASRTKDSVSISVVNPYHLNFWYTLFAGNKVVQRGYGEQCVYQARCITAKNYFISLQYVWSGKIVKEDYTAPYRDKLLQIDIREPAFVYPGQTTAIEIGVKDAGGRPVINADLTAYAVTSKFEDNPAPWVPYLGKSYPGRKRHPDFMPGEGVNLSKEVALNWKRWSREMGLDTLEYYKFLHPAGIYVNTEPAGDRRTQIAPFVSWRGELLPVHQLYIDERPVFFSQAQQLSRYSFYVTPGWHSLKLRTPDRMIRLDSLLIAEGRKTFICIDADTSNKAVRVEKMPDTLTDREKQLWSRYMILVENNFGEKFASISQENRVFLLNARPDPSTYYGRAVLTGPLTGQMAMLRVEGGETDRGTVSAGMAAGAGGVGRMGGRGLAGSAEGSGDLAAGSGRSVESSGRSVEADKGWQQDFEPEGNNRFFISKGLIREKQLPGPYPFSGRLDKRAPDYNFHDRVLTEEEVDSLWQEYLDDRSARWDLFTNETIVKKHSGTLRIGIGEQKGRVEPAIKNLFLFRYDDPDFLRIYKGIDRDLGYLQPGEYRLLILLKGNRYLIRDSIRMLPDGLNYYEIGTISLHEADPVSIRMAGIVSDRERAWRTLTNSREMDEMRETFNDKYLDPATFPRLVSGRVMDVAGLPLTGASVTIKGTHRGVSTDARGYFQLHTPERGTLVINYIGYSMVEKAIRDTSQYEIKLHPASMAMDEVVVVGYGVSRKRDLVGSVTSNFSNTLMGKVAGIQIRGLGTAGSAAAPLVIVDGLPYAGDYSKLDPAGIGSMRVLKQEEASAIYGQSAAGGVILITTKKTGAESGYPFVAASAAGNVVRRRFRDDAFWQPRLTTNEQGIATFTVHYPDDITNWKTRVLAVTGHRQTGFAEGSVKSFKALSANLAGPVFLVKGDSANVIGKMLNYSPDTVVVQRSWAIDDREIDRSVAELGNSRIETFSVQAGERSGDSLKMRYTLLKKDGYFDGEERVLPVYKRGEKETRGVFAALEGDSSFTLSFDPARGPVQIYAESSVLPVLLDEIEGIKNYEYLCNEQLASKLRALLEKKKIFVFLGKEFAEEKNIRELISKLMLARGADGLWGWWSHNEPAPWISLHVTEALLEAEKAGYNTNLNKQLLRDYLVYALESYPTLDKIHSVRLLQELDARVDYKRYIDTIERQIGFEKPGSRSYGMPLSYHAPLYEKLKLLELKQEAGLAIRLDSFLTKHQVTALGNWYWGEENQLFFDNAFQNTVLMYRLLRKEGGHADILRKARNYFLEKRRDGRWRNTYESCLVLETILPDLLGETGRAGAEHGTGQVEWTDTLTINREAAVTIFPYKTLITAGDQLILNKKGRLPLYFTAYQQFWNKDPAKISGEFQVRSSFEKEGEALDRLRAGEPVLLKTEVSVKADADYVLIEIPIPAGCSYGEKEPSYRNNEVHREYFKNKVSIFCRSLLKGDYIFTVSLLPRYTGRYQLNPARAEMMYFPVLYGRESMKTIDIY